MIAPLTIVSGAATLALAILGLAFLVTVFRIVAGPTLPDRVLVAIAIGFIAVIAVKTGFTLYIDIAISLGLVGFLATVAFARFILTRHEQDETASPAEKGAGRRSGLPAGAGKERKRGRRRKGTA